MLLPTGATACVELKRFEEAITWCDKGLAVSFEGIFNFNRGYNGYNFRNFYVLREKIQRRMLMMTGTCQLILKVCVIKKRGKSYYHVTY